MHSQIVILPQERWVAFASSYCFFWNFDDSFPSNPWGYAMLDFAFKNVLALLVAHYH